MCLFGSVLTLGLFLISSLISTEQDTVKSADQFETMTSNRSHVALMTTALPFFLALPRSHIYFGTGTFEVIALTI